MNYKSLNRIILLISLSFFTCFSLFGYENKAKIYDCFLFFNELDLLKVRFEELYDHVDKFVLVESRETFKGDQKPLFFQENLNLFEKYMDKVIYICADNITTTDPWTREAFQRNQIMKGLSGCRNRDIILISDLDEIISSTTIPRIAESLFKDKHKLVVCEQHLYRFFLNINDGMRWPGTAAALYFYIKNKTINQIRGDRISGFCLEDAGWHFTYMGGVSKVIYKLNSFAHNDWDNMFNINDSFEKFKKVFCPQCNLVEIDDTYPRFIRDNIGSFKEKGFIFDGKNFQNNE